MVWTRTRWTTSLGIAAGIALCIGCGDKRPPAPPPPPLPPPPVQVSSPPPPPPRESETPRRPTARPPDAPTEAEIFDRMSLQDLNASEPLGDAFFAYDSSALTSDAQATLQRDTEWLKKWSRTRILVEGHADERGTAEYNLALGERRADTVRKYLEDLGVASARVDIVSKGKEAPFCTTHDEDCWYQNRRGHFIVTAK